ncbi:hypothetical protein JW848_10635 [Candidatus Bipolaricaulota bacterium]|nr:hypothetical protein [Candidatus Bipolaricaulota bacterium]
MHGGASVEARHPGSSMQGGDERMAIGEIGSLIAGGVPVTISGESIDSMMDLRIH